MDNTFQIWASVDGKTWQFHSESDNSFHAIRAARDKAKGALLLRVCNAELNKVLITFKDGMSIPSEPL